MLHLNLPLNVMQCILVNSTQAKVTVRSKNSGKVIALAFIKIFAYIFLHGIFTEIFSRRHRKDAYASIFYLCVFWFILCLSTYK